MLRSREYVSIINIDSTSLKTLNFTVRKLGRSGASQLYLPVRLSVEWVEDRDELFMNLTV